METGPDPLVAYHDQLSSDAETPSAIAVTLVDPLRLMTFARA